jgi:hypothetical protein
VLTGPTRPVAEPAGLADLDVVHARHVVAGILGPLDRAFHDARDHEDPRIPADGTFPAAGRAGFMISGSFGYIYAATG